MNGGKVMAGEPRDLHEKFDALVRSQVNIAARQIVLEDAFVVLASMLAKGTDDPVANMEGYIARLEALLTRKKSLQGEDVADVAAEIGRWFDHLAYALRESVPGATGKSDRQLRDAGRLDGTSRFRQFSHWPVRLNRVSSQRA
jgi:hypothetical protein